MKKITEPQFIINKEIVYQQIKLLEKEFDYVSYSWKTNPKIGELLNKNEDCYFSVHGINELQTIQNKNKIWYFLFATNKEELNHILIKYKLKNIVIDNLKDLEVLTSFLENNNLQINLLLRMKLKENSVFTGKHYVFGMKLNEIKSSIDNLSQNKNILKLGVHFHRKTQNVSEWDLFEEVNDSLTEKYLKKINYINLGGGLPGKYENSHDNQLETIFTKIRKLKSLTDKFNIKLIIEPGRFIASPSVKLNCQIIAIHDDTCFVNISIFNGMLDTVIANIKLIVQEESKSNGSKPYTIKGCTPDSADIIRYRTYLKNPKIGDILTFNNCGAYTYTTNFCALKEIQTLIE
jgi:ornithine decarboxylase